jgi:hypothetical protein
MPQHRTFTTPRERLDAPTRREQVIKAIEDGACTLAEIAGPLGVTRQRVDQIIANQLGSRREWARAMLKANREAARGVTAFGQTKTVARWAADARAGVARDVIRRRLLAGWDAEEAIATPPGARPDKSPVLSEAEATQLRDLAALARTTRLNMPPDAPERLAAHERDRLVREYVERGVRGAHMAEVCGVGLGTVHSWLSWSGWRQGPRYKQVEEG